MAKITLLDGGMGQELVARSGRPPNNLWATQVMLDQPELVHDIHADYFAAGATIATTNTYAIHHDRLVRQGLDHLFADLYAAAIAQATRARDAHGSGRIAGSLGPLGASYRADVAEPIDQAAAKYAEIVGILAPAVDMFIVETSASVAQSEGALKGAAAAGKPVWLSVTVNDADGTHLRSGEAVAELAPIIERYAPAAVLVNCAVPEAMTAALAEVAKFERPFGAYANGFTHITPEFLLDSPTVAALSSRLDLTPDVYARFAMGWVDQGATIVGGCCEVGPAHIAALAAALRDAGHTIV